MLHEDAVNRLTNLTLAQFIIRRVLRWNRGSETVNISQLPLICRCLRKTKYILVLGGDLNPHEDFILLRILSPLCLPISPSGHKKLPTLIHPNSY